MHPGKKKKESAPPFFQQGTSLPPQLSRRPANPSRARSSSAAAHTRASGPPSWGPGPSRRRAAPHISKSFPSLPAWPPGCCSALPAPVAQNPAREFPGAPHSLRATPGPHHSSPVLLGRKPRIPPSGAGKRNRGAHCAPWPSQATPGCGDPQALQPAAARIRDKRPGDIAGQDVRPHTAETVKCPSNRTCTSLKAPGNATSRTLPFPCARPTQVCFVSVSSLTETPEGQQAGHPKRPRAPRERSALR